ncbi:MAG: fibronectin type III domain-containing protein [Bacteroidota bacterium]
MNPFQTYLFLCVMLNGLVLPVLGQQGDSEKSTPAFYLEGERRVDGIALHWYPTASDIWTEQLASGYQLSRSEIDSTGRVISGPEILLDNILPRDTAWFSANAEALKGLMEPIGGLLYDTIFNFPDNDILDAQEMKYNYLVYEATQHNEVAVAIGLGFMDSTASPNKRYQYSVQSANAALNAQIQFRQPYIRFASSQEGYSQEFRFPADQSLSDMLRAAFPVEQEYIIATSRGYGDSVVVRWGPNNPRLWERAKENGFQVYREESPGRLTLLEVVKPWPESRIASAIAEDSMALVAASILYGQKDALKPGNSIYEQTSIFENSLGFALYAAERSPLAGNILGFRYVDRTVGRDSAYSYIISTDGLEDIWLTGKTSGFNTYERPAPPEGLRLEPGDRSLRLIWERESNRSRFSSYTIERSEDGQNFSKLTRNNIVFIETERLPITAFSYTDTVAENGKTYYYRLRGYDSFGETSDGAEVSGQGVDMSPPQPVQIVDVEYFDDTQTIVLNWERSGPFAEDFSHYQVLMGEVGDGPFGAISENLDSTETAFQLELKGMDLDRGFFFTVSSYDKSGNVSTSYPRQAVVPDIIAPLPPENLTGFVDSSGFVTLSWEHSTSKDVEGYWLYFGNRKDAEFSPVNKEPLTQNFHVYALPESSLTKRIFYTVRAEDDSYNRSVPSEVIEVKLPDKIPPEPPYAINVMAKEMQLMLNWSLSASEDVAGQLLYKRGTALTDTGFVFVDSLSARQQTYVDASVRIGEVNRYMLRAWDESGNLSRPSFEGKGELLFPVGMADIQDLTVGIASADGIELKWQFQALNEQLKAVPYTYEIHRAVGGGALSLYEEVAAGSQNYTDLKVQSNVLYQYAIRVRFENGWLGNKSEIKSVLVNE